MLGSNQRLIKRLNWNWNQLALEGKNHLLQGLHWDLARKGLPPLTTKAVGFMGLKQHVRSLVAEGLLSQPVVRILDEEDGASGSRTPQVVARGQNNAVFQPRRGVPSNRGRRPKNGQQGSAIPA